MDNNEVKRAFKGKVKELFTKKIQSGYEPERVEHKVGDKWTDSDGDQWEQKQGYISKVSKLASAGIADECSDCEKLIFKSYDKDTYTRMGRCYHCQINFEVDLKHMKIGENGNKWNFWVKLQVLKRWESIDKDIEQFVDESDRLKNKKVYDDSVVNAIANDNVKRTIRKNKKLTGQ